MILSALLAALFFQGLELPQPALRAWHRVTVLKAAQATTEAQFVHDEWVGCTVQLLRPSAGGGVILSNEALDRSILIQKVGGKPFYFDLRKLAAGVQVAPDDPDFAYCLEAVQSGKGLNSTIKSRFLGFGGIK